MIEGAVMREICLFLEGKETFGEICVVNKALAEVLNTGKYKAYWVRRYFRISAGISDAEVMEVWMSNAKNRVLNYAPWKTNAGVSQHEVSNRFENMWNYNGSAYSTYYTFQDLPLRANVNCLSTFGGGFQATDAFFQGVNGDLLHLNLSGYTPPRYESMGNSLEKCLVLDPLNQINYNTVDDLPQENRLLHEPTPVLADYELPRKTTKDLPIVTKLAVARPFFFTGAVKTLFFIASEAYSEVSYQELDQFNGVTDQESAENLGRVVKRFESDEFRYVEYERKEGIYPLVWFQFKSEFANHFVLQLTQAHLVRVCCVKLIENDDRRLDYQLSYAQPNFDVTYTLLIGHSTESLPH